MKPEQDPPAPKVQTPKASKSSNFSDQDYQVETNEVYEEIESEDVGYWFIEEKSYGPRLVMVWSNGDWKGFTLKMNGNKLTLNGEVYNVLDCDGLKPACFCDK